MKVIATHQNADFDGAASVLAASKLYPDAVPLLPDQQQPMVKQFFAIYKDELPFQSPKNITHENVTSIVLVDTSQLQRIGDFSEKWRIEKVDVFDHHPVTESSFPPGDGEISNTGAAVTLLIERLAAQQIELSSIEATLLGLGLYTDTGSLSFTTTTKRDLQAAVFLMDAGMNLALIHQFSSESLTTEQQQMFQDLLNSVEEIELEGQSLLIAHTSSASFKSGLGILSAKVLETTGAHGVFAVAAMDDRIFVTGRSQSERLDVRPLIQELGGGGHAKAAAATVKHQSLQEIIHTIHEHAFHCVKPALKAEDLMSSPVKTLRSDVTIQEAKDYMTRYSHTGFPIIDNDELTGIISKRDVDKAIHHGLGHAPVKGYMSTHLVTLQPEEPLERIQKTMITKNVGRLPVVQDGQVIGIVSRTDLIHVLHNEDVQAQLYEEENATQLMHEQFSKETIHFLQQVGELADELDTNAYMIGGIVRDLFLRRPNEDIDIAVEGKADIFAEKAAERFKGTVQFHESFGTAQLVLPNGDKIDVTSSRTEYYLKPAALPTVERSNVQEDLARRDFTINAMAIQLNSGDFGRLIDAYNGKNDLTNKVLRTLHNLSFVEDPTRILRAVRFETRLGYKMDKDTENFARQRPTSIQSLSKDRVWSEFQHFLQEVAPGEMFARLEELDVLDAFMPGASFKPPVVTALFQRVRSNNLNVDEKMNTLIQLLALFTESRSSFEKSLLWMRSNPERTLVQQIISLYDTTWIKDVAYGALHDAFSHVQNMSLWFTSRWFEAADESEKAYVLYTYFEKKQSMPELINGDDLRKFGLSPGPQYKEIIHKVEKAWFDALLTTRDEALSFAQGQVEAYMKQLND
ncbi:tRNA nucleotidyltransferase (CCA-adding enzyme) [Salsuginibacillus halophilus]|uniref:tRNA nucleotidyltransferase (CCA-adding enzyme) n=1 Tax=Salsuginibacillus halophilus TaxID=517424 RepID=A0A2P8HXJ2_9BACI|nr:CBS domain-containing protein [Salsuginibacillus halophilus]PSL50930.1 tRNA nucleotidyltransferase (CCA-adding enzyme) [Salsuginibacillus halophilus]